MAKYIYLIRHCQSEGQQPDAPLTEKGHQDAIHLANILKESGIERIISSPYKRAVDTIRPLAEQIGISIRTDERFSERVLTTENLPDWLDRLRLTFEDFDLKLKGGESSAEATDRAIQALDEYLLSDFQKTAIVTHGNLLALILHFFDKPFGFEGWQRLTNPDVYLLVLDNGHHHVKRIWS